jgi:hypothetical protein
MLKLKIVFNIRAGKDCVNSETGGLKEQEDDPPNHTKKATNSSSWTFVEVRGSFSFGE